MAAKPAARAASKAYLRRVDQTAPGCTRRNLNVMRHFAAFAECMLDRFLLWSGNFDLSRVEIHGDEQLARLIAPRRGALLICSHLGNLDLCRVLCNRNAAVRVTFLMHTKHAGLFNQLLMRINPNSQLNIMQVSEITPATAMLLADKISAGEFVAIAGDRVPISAGNRTAAARFLGDAARFPIGPYILGALLSCPVFLMFSIRKGELRQVHFELFREAVSLPRHGRDQALAALVAEFAGRLEYYCRQAPFEWFNFYDFWGSSIDVIHETR
jgi:predicted LPLAT superfamily acyltransferase